MKMNFCVRLPVTGAMASADSIRLFAQNAESLGYYAVTTHDHVYINYEKRYHTAGGAADILDAREKMGLPIGNVYETLSVFSYVAGMTERILMIPCAVVLPIRDPILYAKQAITLDHLSDGRYVSNVCIGNIASDFEASRVDFSRRGKIMEEYIQILKQIFSTGKISFQGKYASIPEIEIFPRPKNLPLWYAGHFSPSALRRAAKYATGFFPGTTTPEQYIEGLPKLRKNLKKYGRKESDIKTIGNQNFLCLREDGEKARRSVRYTLEAFYHGRPKERMEGAYKNGLIGSPDDVIKNLQRYANAGANTVDLRINAAGIDDGVQMIKLFAREVMPSFN